MKESKQPCFNPRKSPRLQRHHPPSTLPWDVYREASTRRKKLLCRSEGPAVVVTRHPLNLFGRSPRSRGGSTAADRNPRPPTLHRGRFHAVAARRIPSRLATNGAPRLFELLQSRPLHTRSSAPSNLEQVPPIWIPIRVCLQTRRVGRVYSEGIRPSSRPRLPLRPGNYRKSSVPPPIG